MLRCVSDVLEHMMDEGEFSLVLNEPPTEYEKRYTPFKDMSLSSKIIYIHRILSNTRFIFTITDINFSHCQLTHKHTAPLNGVINSFPLLHTLDLSNNLLEDISITETSALRVLHLHHNSLGGESINAIISNDHLSSLRILTINHNNYNDPAVCRLPNLIELHTDGPMDVSRVVNLQSLHVRYMTERTLYSTWVLPCIVHVTHGDPAVDINDEQRAVFEMGRGVRVKRAVILMCAGMPADVVRQLSAY
jgi:hypothetical protein